MFTPHYTDVTMSPMASRITSLGIVYSTVYSVADQRKHQSSASLAFVRRIHRGPVNSPHKWPVTRKMFPFDDVIMLSTNSRYQYITWQWDREHSCLQLPLFNAFHWRSDKQLYICAMRILRLNSMHHDDVIKWKHFPRYRPFVRGIHRWPVNSRTKASDAELWCFLWSAPE